MAPAEMKELLERFLGVEVKLGAYESVNFTAEELEETLPDERYSALTNVAKLLTTVEFTLGGQTLFAHFVQEPNPNMKYVEAIIIQNEEGMVTRVEEVTG